jgi:hypothetical protein
MTRWSCLLLASLAGCHLAFPHEPRAGDRDGAARPDLPVLEDRGVPDRAGEIRDPAAGDGQVEQPRADVTRPDLFKPDLLAPDLGCGSDSECDDKDPCTVDACKLGSCAHAPKCTKANQVCQGGACVCKAGTALCAGSCVPGECCSGTIRTCDRCGTEACVNNKWAGCTGQRDCNSGENCMCEDYPSCTSGPCAGCVYHAQKSCNPDCQWGGCYGG